MTERSHVAFWRPAPIPARARYHFTRHRVSEFGYRRRARQTPVWLLA